MTGSEPRNKWSVNLTDVQVIAWAIGRVVAAVGVIWVVLSFVTGYQFQKELDIFHERAQPAIRGMVDEKIRLHRAEAEQPVFERLDKLEGEDNLLEQNLENLKASQERNTRKLDEIDNKMDELKDLIIERTQ